jgi:3-mercaptopyruvate sulfurtransferase SseA
MRRTLKSADMKPQAAVVGLLAVILWTIISFAAQAHPRYPVDPRTNWALGAKPKLADELKKELDGGKILIIDVRAPEQFQKETIPGAINVPLEVLDGHLKKLAKDTYIVFT